MAKCGDETHRIVGRTAPLCRTSTRIAYKPAKRFQRLERKTGLNHKECIVKGNYRDNANK